MACPLAKERIWTDKVQYQAAEKQYHEYLSKNRGAGPSSLASEIAKARQHIKNSLERMDGIAALASTPSAELLDRLSSIEKQTAQFHNTVNNLQIIVHQLQEKVRTLELGLNIGKQTVQTTNTSSQVTKSPSAPTAVAKPNEDDDDGVDLFGSDSEDEDEAAAKVREQRLADYAAKKSKKVALIAKSNIILDIKPWSDETDMKEMEKEVRAIKMDGLLWGAAKLVPLAYGIHKLQISTVVEDEKVSIDALQEEITNIEELVQSVDIAAFNKI